FEGTRLWKALHDEDSELAAWEGWKELTTALEQIAESFGVDWKELEKGLLGFGGRFTLAMGFDKDGLSVKHIVQGTARPWYMLVVSPDDKTDLESLNAFLRKVAEEDEADMLESLEVDGSTYRFTRFEDEDQMWITLPFMAGKHMVIVAGERLEETLGSTVGQKGARLSTGNWGFDSKSVAALLNIVPFRKMAGGLAEEFGVDFDAEEVEGLIELLGLQSPQYLQFSLHPGKENVLADLAIKLDGRDRGIFDVFTPSLLTEASLLELVPYDWDTWGISAFDTVRLYEIVAKVFERYEDRIGMPWSTVETIIQQKIKVHPKLDILDHLGKQFMAVGTRRSVEFGEMIRESQRNFGGTCFGISLKSPSGFVASFDKVLRSLGLHAGRRRDTYKVYQINRVLLGGLFPIYYTVSDRVFLLATGDEGVRAMKAILDEEQNRTQHRNKGAAPPHVASRLRHAPSGWSGLSLSSIENILDLALVQSETRMEQTGVGPTRRKELLATAKEKILSVLELLKKHRLEYFVSLTAHDAEGLLWRAIW
ncbi:MAG: hypothetical protein ACE5F1_08835, partial [Planctomycetota bacterium]